MKKFLLYVYNTYLIDKDWKIYNRFGKILLCPAAVVRAIIFSVFILCFLPIFILDFKGKFNKIKSDFNKIKNMILYLEI
jgi:hypothetical protein